ncbi:BZ3500_MvSof-1268-A1-R1_Chr10-1g02559 [Microbotryum saponariae]|uniref:BZ3500_MvSof-1268-A1-R1_Chr10-1g02559 protein n=1 Tax=Microbotryum saponariae TaxID=289078 RepID=A0A2X0LLJ7_9BASI|nr:BZ3500_MvSof-1268-A1-R1_Chr10-1g02559 [Microbotryum saponariae]SDA06048.1 BZ3501_MvSof-1269-A2-R1_Chr10-1g02160 [Microbotryum saponariae]
MVAILSAELLNAILPASLPAATRDGVRPRNAQLCTLAQLDRTWQRFAQAQLEDCLRLRGEHFRKLEQEHPDRSPSPTAERRRADSSLGRHAAERARDAGERGRGSPFRSSSSACHTDTDRDDGQAQERGRSLLRRTTSHHKRTPIVLPGGARERASKVKTLVIDKCLDQQRYSVVKRSLAAFDQVEKVYLAGTGEWYALTSLNELPNLTSLHLARVYHALPPSQPFSSLTTLSISFGLPKHVDWALLRARLLPALKTFILHPVDWDFIQEQGATFYPAFEEIAPQLEAVLFAGQDHRLDEPVDWARMMRRLNKVKVLELRLTSGEALKSVEGLWNTEDEGEHVQGELRLGSKMMTNGRLRELLFPMEEAAVDQDEVMVPRTRLRGLQKLCLPEVGGGEVWRRTKTSIDFDREDREAAKKWCALYGVELSWTREDECELVEEWKA